MIPPSSPAARPARCAKCHGPNCTQTSLASALNLAYTAEQISLFGIVVGIALLLTGIGLLILAVAVLHRAPATAVERESEPAPSAQPTAAH